MQQQTRTINAVFSEEQIKEQKQFLEELGNDTANIAFEGTFAEGMDYLQETGKLVDACIHS